MTTDPRPPEGTPMNFCPDPDRPRPDRDRRARDRVVAQPGRQRRDQPDGHGCGGRVRRADAGLDAAAGAVPAGLEAPDAGAPGSPRATRSTTSLPRDRRRGPSRLAPLSDRGPRRSDHGGSSTRSRGHATWHSAGSTSSRWTPRRRSPPLTARHPPSSPWPQHRRRAPGPRRPRAGEPASKRSPAPREPWRSGVGFAGEAVARTSSVPLEGEGEAIRGPPSSPLPATAGEG